jgi:F420-dependent methylenetetrahydromethanopterin dehydrogenase
MKIIQTKQLAAIDLARKISQIMFKHCYINKKILSYFTELEIQNS